MLSHQLFEAELTETILMSNTIFSENVINELHKTGISFSIDDFGTGYSTLTHLKTLPIRAIKIDKSFVKNIGINKKDTIIVETVIQLGDRLGLDVVAEGIETAEQLNFLIQNKCPKGQGHLLCPPLSVDEMTDLLKKTFVL